MLDAADVSIKVNPHLHFQSNLSDISIDPDGDYLDYTLDSELSKLSPDPNDRLLSPRAPFGDHTSDRLLSPRAPFGDHTSDRLLSPRAPTGDQASDDRTSSDFRSEVTDVTKSDATDITDVVDIMEDPREYEVR